MESSQTQSPKARASLSRLILSFVLAFCVMAGVMYMIGPRYIRAFLPVFSKQISLLHPEYDISEFYLNEQNQIMFQVRVNRFMIDDQGRHVGGTEAKAGIQGYSMYTAPIILFAVILAWPGLGYKTRFKAFLIALPLFILTQLVDIPVLVINRVEAYWPAVTFGAKLRMFWAFVLANGGTQFMAFLAALVSIFATQWVLPPPAAPAMKQVARNEPCPCGSGKKFKRCCGK